MECPSIRRIFFRVNLERSFMYFEKFSYKRIEPCIWCICIMEGHFVGLYFFIGYILNYDNTEQSLCINKLIR